MKSKVVSRIENRIYKLAKDVGGKVGLDLPYFVKNGSWVVLRQAVVAIGGLLLSVAFARMATQEVFGQYQLVLSILAMVSILSISGLNTSLIRSVARGYDGDYKKVVKISFLWSLLGIPTLLGIGGYYYLYQDQSLGIALMISSMFFPFFYAPNTWDSFLQGKSRFDISAKYSSIQMIVNTIATISIIFFSRGNLIPIISVYLIPYTFFNGYYFWKSWKYIENKKTNQDTIKYGWFLTKMNVLVLISEHIDKILIGIIISPTALATYYIVAFLPIKIKEFGKPFFNVIFPKLASENVTIYKLIRDKVILFVGLFFGITVGAFIYWVVISRISAALFGENYREFYEYSKIYVVLLVLMIPLNIFAKYIQAKKQKIVIIMTDGVYPVVRIVINVIFILKYGIFGAVVAYNVCLVILLAFYIGGIYFLDEKSTLGGS